MAKFVDAENRSWTPEVNVVTIGRVRSALKINLLELLLPNSTLGETLSDPCLMVDVLYLLCKDQAEKCGVTDEAFGKAMTPDGIEDGWNAVLEGVVSFSPRGLRPAHQRVLEKAKAYQTAAADRIKEMVAGKEFDARLDKAIKDRLNQLEKLPSESTGDASSLQESSESSPGETPSPG